MSKKDTTYFWSGVNLEMTATFSPEVREFSASTHSGRCDPRSTLTFHSFPASASVKNRRPATETNAVWDFLVVNLIRCSPDTFAHVALLKYG